jgi:choline kinase
MKATIVYLLAGMSKRFGGKAKGLSKIGPNGETLIEYSLNQSLKAGFNNIVFIVSEKSKELYEKAIGNNYKGIPISYALQEYDEKEREKPWGTFDALCSALHLIETPFVICNGDDIYGESSFKILFEHLKNEKTPVTLGYKLEDNLPEKEPANRGIFSIEEGFVKSIVETLEIQKDKLKEKGISSESLCSMNIFGFPKESTQDFQNKINEFKQQNLGNRTIECFLPTEISNLINLGKIKMKIYPTKDNAIGLTYPEDEEKVRKQLLKQ